MIDFLIYWRNCIAALENLLWFEWGQYLMNVKGDESLWVLPENADILLVNPKKFVGDVVGIWVEQIVPHRLDVGWSWEYKNLGNST